MATTSLTKVGNSMAVLLPKTLREEAGLNKDTPLNITTPRKGVVVITAIHDDRKDRLERLKQAEACIAENAKKMKPIPKGLSARELIKAGKDAKVDEILSL